MKASFRERRRVDVFGVDGQHRRTGRGRQFAKIVQKSVIAQPVGRERYDVRIAARLDSVAPVVVAEKAAFELCPANIVEHRLDLGRALIHHDVDIFEPRPAQIDDVALDQRHVDKRDGSTGLCLELIFGIYE